jgi:hypothetical protein
VSQGAEKRPARRRGGKANPPAAARRGHRRGSVQGTRLHELLASARGGDLRELYQFWAGHPNGAVPDTDEEIRLQLRDWMSDPQLVEDRVVGLGRRLGAVIEQLLCSPRFERNWVELLGARSLGYLTEYDLEACLAALVRRGLVVESHDRRFESLGERVLVIPPELGNGILARRRERMHGIFGTLTLRGHLDQTYSEPNRGRRITPQRIRELYKMYARETAAVARIERLPDGVRGLVEKVILEYGGILPRQQYERMGSDVAQWSGPRWRPVLEQSLVGTVRKVDLLRYGIQHQDETLVVFNEVALAWLRRVAIPGDPDRPHEELCLGIDLASNIARFLAYLDENDVRYTVRGEIFKTTERRILQRLIANPGRELSREDVLSFIFRFCKSEGLLDRTGERTFVVSALGRTWPGRPLLEKQTALYEFALDDRKLDGEFFHQTRMRRIFARMIKRVEVGVWYDLMYLPFLARNSYLASLDDLQVEEHFAARSQHGRFPSMEDPQRLAWHLVKWTRKRLYLLGMIDLGYDQASRPVAMRLTPAGARILRMDLIGPVAPSHVGSLVVTPDFEVVLFPTGDDSELLHDLDMFCVRVQADSVMHLTIDQDSIRRALKVGMSLSDILEVLEEHSRTPIPQNVHFSIRDWAIRAGLMTLGRGLLLRGEEPEVIRRFCQDPGTRPYLDHVIDELTVQMKGRMTPKRCQAVLRDLGYLVELEEAIR